MSAILKKSVTGGKQISHFSQLRKSAIYLVKGKLCRYTGETRRVGIFRRERPIFRGHANAQGIKVGFTAKVTECSTVDADGVRAYLGRRPDEPIGSESGNETGFNARVRAMLGLPKR